MTEQEIINKVRNIMNEAGEEAKLSLLSEDTVKLDEYIKSSIPDAVDIIIANSPVRCVNKKSNTSARLVNSGDGTGYLILPDDYVSLIAFKITGWKRIVAMAYPIESEEYKVQCNEYTRSGLHKPTCFLSYNSAGDRILEFYASGTLASSKVDTFVYEGKYDSTNGLGLSPNDPLSSAVCYMCASLVYSIFENEKTAKEMQTISLNLIPQK